MKKVLSLLMMVCVLVLCGCSCSKEGEYEFEYFVLEDKKYTCTDRQEIDPTTGPICSAYEDIEIFLSKDGKMTTTLDDVIVEESFYKIEGGKFFVSLADKQSDNNYTERGTYKRGKLTIIIDNLKVVFEK